MVSIGIPVQGPRIVPFGEERLPSDTLPNGRPAFRVTQTYDSVDWYWQQQGIIRKHGALDLGNHHCDDAVISPGPGKAFPLKDEYGALGVEVRLDNGLIAQMWHLGKVNIDFAQVVKRGTFLGRNGGTGLANGVCHVHFVVIRDGKLVDPWPLLEQNQKRWAQLNAGSGVNIRAGKGNEDRIGNLFASARNGRIIRTDGKDLGPVAERRTFGGHVRGYHHGIEPHPDEWSRIRIAGAYRFVARPLVKVSR